VMRWLLRLLYPPKCVFCDAVVENDRFAVCENCMEDIPHNTRACRVCGMPLDTVFGELICTRCRKKKRAFEKAYVPFVYKDKVRSAILRFKFGNRQASGKTLAAYIFLKIRALEGQRPDLITFVPMHFIRRGMRGYNQAELLARALGKMMHVPVKPTLRKTKHILPQSKLGGRERQIAPRDVYKRRKGADVAGKKILLLDDVITTGTTLDICARVLKTAGADTVEVATVAATAFIQK